MSHSQRIKFTPIPIKVTLRIHLLKKDLQDTVWEAQNILGKETSLEIQTLKI